ncbi:MAG: META domain-containing protein [Candidatus Electrothrix sp. ATG1]|nr:META domain-containing protein [Candidatus Electrothrix sp. ATG1]
MDQENTFLAALQDAATYRIDGRRLTLYKTDGSVAVHLKRD